VTESEQRAAVLREALSWVGTPFRDCGQIKGPGGGCDCGTFLIGVFSRTGLVDYFIPENYSADFMLHSGEERYLSLLLERTREITEAESQPADVVLYKIGRVWCHGAIITERGWDHIIHASKPAGGVVPDHGLGGLIGDRPRRFFSYWGRE
jgi:cell wall-associated NlpC family hydrolase